MKGSVHQLTEKENRQSATEQPSSRRHFLAVGASLGATVIAGCSGTTDTTTNDGDSGANTNGEATDSTRNDSSPGSSERATGASGTFRLLISDQPVAIDEFDALDVSFDRARIFRGDADDDGDGGETATADGADETTGTEVASATETVTATSTATATESSTEAEVEDEEDASENDDHRGFFVIDLDGATVDLTTVLGEKAIGVFDGELPEGRYTKVELYAASVEGIVDGEPVEVKIPSGKLQIVKPFEVVADETVRFVFDINVVKKGQSGGYNLLPVISESGVAGEDVEVTEVGDEEPESERNDGTDANGEESEDGETEAEETETSGGDDANDDGEGDGEGNGPPDDADGDS